MKTKREIDRDYYLRHREKILARVAQYQKDYPESHREASREYETKKRARLRLEKEQKMKSKRKKIKHCRKSMQYLGFNFYRCVVCGEDFVIKKGGA